MKLNDVHRTLFFVARETGEAMKNDPALALRSSATMLQGLLMNGVSDEVKLSTSQAVVPVIRTALLGANAVQAYRTFHRGDANGIDKTMDVLRVATDMVGVVGAMAMAFAPNYAKLGTSLVGVAYAADLISHGYRGITHADRRLRVWEAELNSGHSQPPVQAEPQKPPASGPTPIQPSQPVPTRMAQLTA